jgi:hypothetical protein
MPKYVIEREMPGAGNLSAGEMQHAAAHSCSALDKLEGVQWLESVVTGDKVFCIYIAPSEEAIREHARIAGFPANAIREIKAVIDPSTAEAHA